MAEQTAAASSPAEDVFRGETPTLAEYNAYRDKGEVPERFKPAGTAGTAPDDRAEETPSEDNSESAGESETPNEQNQEPPAKKHATAEQRISQLRAKVEELWEQAEPDTIRIAQLETTIDKIEKGSKRKTEPAPVAPQQQQNEPRAAAPLYAQSPPRPEDVDDKGNPKYKTYEDFVDARADWRAARQIAQFQQEQAQAAALNAMQVKLDESRTRYADADSVIFPAAQTIAEARIPNAVKEVFAGSDLFTDLCYVVGTDPDELQKFVNLAAHNPRAAIAKVFEYERGIREELAKADGANSGTAPEVKRTNAPKPPSPVQGGSSRTFDASDESLSPEQWMKKRNKQLGIG